MAATRSASREVESGRKGREDPTAKTRMRDPGSRVNGKKRTALGPTEREREREGGGGGGGERGGEGEDRRRRSAGWIFSALGTFTLLDYNWTKTSS